MKQEDHFKYTSNNNDLPCHASFLKLVQINYIFSNNVCILYIYLWYISQLHIINFINLSFFFFCQHHKLGLVWTGFKLTTLVVIVTDCTGSCKSNYHTITTTTAPICVVYVLKTILCDINLLVTCSRSAMSSLSLTTTI